LGSPKGGWGDSGRTAPISTPLLPLVEKVESHECDAVLLLKAINHKDDPQCRMTDAEVMTTAIIAALDYGGNLEKARRMLKREGYIPDMLSKSRFNRCWHANAHLFLPWERPGNS
jgi:hypothetical protein